MVLNLGNGILFSNEKEYRTESHNWMNQGITWSESSRPKSYILCDSTWHPWEGTRVGGRAGDRRGLEQEAWPQRGGTRELFGEIG